jgi:PadR family transcriptional regulator PadR
MAHESVGDFEQQVMLVILRLKGRSYSTPIVRELESQAGRTVSPSAVFIALRRLEKRGFVLSEHEPPREDAGGRGKRFFSLTDSGVEVLKAARRILEDLWDGLDLVFDK